MCRWFCRSLILVTLALMLGTVLTPSTMAQVCNGTNVVTALGALNDKVPGPPSPQSDALLRYTFGNDVTSDCDSDQSNGGVEQVVTQVIIRPSCNISGGACLPDPGGDDGNPNTPAIAFLSLDATTCTGGLANITVDSSDPYAIKLNFTTPLTFAPNTSCSVDITLNVRERGNATTTSTIAQQYATDGLCQCEPELTAGGSASSQLILTCPPCSTNFCAPEVCNPTTVQCDAQPLPDCSNPDNDLCTPGSCDPTANGGVGACVNGPRTVCGNEGSFCTPNHCEATSGNCVQDTPPDCSNPDNDLCTPGSCDEGQRACVNGPRTTCENTDNDLCTPEECNASTGSCETGTRTVCGNEGSFCTPGHCEATSGECVQDTPPDCSNPDNDLCTPGSCDPTANGGVGACVNGTRTVCGNEESFCNPGHCEATSGNCVQDTPPDCSNPDNDLCTPGSCDEGQRACVNGTTKDCDDDNVCTDDACVPASGECSNVPKPPEFCDDSDPCTEDTCDPQDGCVHAPPEVLPPECSEAICRTPGFWATHAGVEKSPGNGQPAVNITEAVIDCADGNCSDHTASDFLLICGERIDSPDSNPADGTTDANDAASSTEAMCVDVHGDSRLQLARQLTAAALNCLISGGGADCAGTGLYTQVFGDCNTTCTDTTSSNSDITACIAELDCLNNGGSFENGLCTAGGPNNCHERILVNETLGLDFDPPGSAGSSDACQKAKQTRCAVVGPRETLCGTDSLP